MWLSRFWARISLFARPRRSKGLRGVHSVEQFHIILERERARADRNQQQFSLVDFEVGDSETNSNQVRILAHILTNRIRLVDEAGWLDRQRIGVLLPYTQATGARKLAEDVCQKISVRSLPPKYTVNTYPSRSRGPSDRSGHSGPFHIQDIPSKRKTTASSYSSASTKHTGRRNIDFTSQQPKANRTSDRGELAEGLKPFFLRPLPAWKRAMDIVGATVALIVFSPIMVAVAIVIKLTSKGPVIFKQQRAGYRGREFTMWKLRTMKPNTDSSRHEQHVSELINNNNPMTKLDSDLQTPLFGRILRKCCIDELPQLINVLCGKMSLVGPRPDVPYVMRYYEPWYNARFDVVPGLTGLWQVRGKNATTYVEMVRLDIAYARERSFWLDMKILLMTVPTIIAEIKNSLFRR